MDIYFIFDTSGSMDEMGKIHLQRNLVRYAIQVPSLAQENCTDFVIRLYQWHQDISDITLQSDGDIPSLTAKGSSSLAELSDFLSQHVYKSGVARVLILSDGNFPSSDTINFQNQLCTFPDLIIRTVAVGADADLLKLRKLSTNNTVYLPENIASAMNSTLFGSDEPVTAPVSAAQIQHSAPAETAGPEEDWDA